MALEKVNLCTIQFFTYNVKSNLISTSCGVRKIKWDNLFIVFVTIAAFWKLLSQKQHFLIQSFQ